MAITKLNQHDNCTVSVNLCKPNSVHYAALVCKDCKKHIQWLSKRDFFLLKTGTHINNNNNTITTNNYLKNLLPLAANKKTNMSLRDSLGYATSQEVQPIREGEPLDSGARQRTPQEVQS